jgi:tetratricopeptide (TPR) repeat protein
MLTIARNLSRLLFVLALLQPLTAAAQCNDGIIAIGPPGSTSANFEKGITLILDCMKKETPDKPYKDAHKAKAYTRLGQGYVKVVTMSAAIATLKDKYPNALLDAYGAFSKAMEFDKDKKMDAEIKADLRSLSSQLINVGNTAFGAKDYKKAIEYCTASAGAYTASNTKFYGVYQLRGYAYIAQGDTANAIKDFELALKTFKEEPVKEQENDHKVMYRYLCILYASFGKDPQKALDIINEGRAKYPEDNDIKQQELDLYLRYPSLYEKAVVRFEQETRVSPNDYMTWVAYGNLLENKEKSKAIEAYKKAASIKPDDFRVNFSVGAFYVNEAVEIQKKAQNTTDGKELEKLNEEIRGNLRMSQPYLEKAHEAKPDNYDVISALISVYTNIGLDDKAMEMVNKRKALAKPE